MSSTQAGLIELLSFMADRFNSSDLQHLCFQLGVDYEDIPGPGKQAKIRELIQYMNRHSQLCDLVQAVGKARPKSIKELNKIVDQLGCALVEVEAALPQDEVVHQGDHVAKAQIVQQEERPLPPKEDKASQTYDAASNLQIVNRTGRPLLPTATTILQTIFANHSHVIIRSEFGSGLSGSQVFLVRPVRQDKMAELPAVVKVDRAAAVRREWRAYHDCIERRLPGVAEIRDEPVFTPDGQWGGLSYPMAGEGAFDVQSFHEYYQNASTDDVTHILAAQLSRSLSKLWQQSTPEWDFHVGTFYDSFLPMNLVIDCRQPAAVPTPLTPQNALYNKLQTGDAVQLSGFRVARVFAEQSRLSLDMPRNQAAAYRLAVHVDSVTGYEEGQILSGTLTGVVTKMRHELLREQGQRAMGNEMAVTAVPLRTPNGQLLPNPLDTLSKILNQTFDTRLACLHGDLNLQNILVEPESRTVRLIDFAKAGRNYVLRDLICLEMNIVTRLMPPAIAEAMLTPEDIVGCYEKLHCTLKRPNVTITPPAGLEKPFAVLHTLRQQAHPYLFTADKWDEYYYGLIIYFLGALKFGDLDLLPAAPWPKQLAFYGAAAVQKLLDEGESVCEETATIPTPAMTSTPTIAPTRPAYSDPFAAYEHGLQNLLDQLGSAHPAYADALLYQQRLSENIHRARRFGDTASRRADRAEILDQLNALTLNTLDTSFNDLCH